MSLSKFLKGVLPTCFILFICINTLNAQDHYRQYLDLLEEAKLEFNNDSIKALGLINQIKFDELSSEDSAFVKLALLKLDFLTEYYNSNLVIQEANSIIDICIEKERVIPEAKIHNYLAELFLEYNELDSSDYHINKAIEIYQSVNRDEKIGELLLKKAVIQYSQDDYIKSIETVFEAIDKFKNSNLEKQLAFSYLQIGSTYLYINYLDKAEEYYQLAGEHFLKMEDTLGFAICTSNLGLIEFERKDYEASIHLLKLALSDLLKSERQIMIAFAYQAIGESYLESGHIDSAARYTHLSHIIDNKLEYNYGKTKDYYLLARIKERTNQLDSSLYFAEKAHGLLKNEPDLEIDYDLSFLLANLYEKKGNVQLSSKFLRRLLSIKDSLDREKDYINQLSQVENLKLKETEFALKIAKEKGKRNEEENKHQKVLILVLFFILIVILSGLIALLIIYRKKRQLTEKLANELITNQSLLKEIHHRIKNNLQIISSMLNIQSQYINDSQVQKVLSECRGRISSMALIHESLYKKEDNDVPLFSDYIRQLIPLLVKTYNLDESKVKLKMDLKDFELSLDESIPCGLIINEVVSNSIKHAFEGEDSGEILIRLFLKNDKVKLEISDNGIGLPKEFEEKGQNTFGFLLINTLANQLEATLKVSSNNGVSVFVEWEKDFMLKE